MALLRRQETNAKLQEKVDLRRNSVPDVRVSNYCAGACILPGLQQYLDKQARWRTQRERVLYTDYLGGVLRELDNL